MYDIKPQDPHKIYINVKWLYLVLVFLFVIVTIPVLTTVHSIRAEKMEKQSCKNFKTQPEAQAIYDRYIYTEYAKYVRQLDADHDKIACEFLPLK
jgi:hypothetical protein